MKALLITRCGCSKLIDINEDPNDIIYIPLKPNDYEPINVSTGHTAPIYVNEYRKFELAGKTRIREVGVLFKYEEV